MLLLIVLLRSSSRSRLFFFQFYENCSVNNAETPELKASRLSLCMATAATIRLLLDLLGIQVVERL